MKTPHNCTDHQRLAEPFLYRIARMSTLFLESYDIMPTATQYDQWLQQLPEDEYVIFKDRGHAGCAALADLKKFCIKQDDPQALHCYMSTILDEYEYNLYLLLS